MSVSEALFREPLADILRLIRTPNIGPVTFFHLLERYGSCAEALDALPELSKRGGRSKPLIAISQADAEKEIEATQKFGARFIVYGAPDYPRMLMELSDAPPALIVFGDATLWDKPSVAIVGARNASANGCQFAQKLARDLGAGGYCVVSGLARGIDSFVHRGALASGTIGVIAGGINNIYPSENAPLYEQMKAQGAIISEQPFGAIPFAGSFPSRNRIIAGMTLGTLVVEAAPQSGSLITARMALESNREVMAVPGSPLDPRSKGCNGLIKNGATLIENAGDIITCLSQHRQLGFAETPRASYAYTPASEDKINYEELQSLVLEKLGPTAVLVDELIEQCQTPAGSVLTVLLELELAGRLRRSAGNKVYMVSHSEEEVA